MFTVPGLLEVGTGNRVKVNIAHRNTKVLSVMKKLKVILGYRGVLCGEQKEAQYLSIYQDIATDTNHRITCLHSYFNCVAMDNGPKKGIPIHSCDFFFFIKKKKSPWISLDHLNAFIKNKHQILCILFIKSTLNNAEILLQQRV